ncbi:GumC family protein [Zhengella mangrovi]|nr:GumC family protein [Zhengella mangrovi]
MTRRNAKNTVQARSLLSMDVPDEPRAAVRGDTMDVLAARYRKVRERREAKVAPPPPPEPVVQETHRDSRDDRRERLLAERRQRLEEDALLRDVALLREDIEYHRQALRDEAGDREAPPDPGKAAPGTKAPRQDRDRLRPPAGRGSRDAGQAPWQPLIDPSVLVDSVLRSKRLIAGTTLAGALIGVLVALATPRHYVSTAEVLVDPRDIKVAERDLTGGGLPSDATLAIIENQVRVMYSGDVLKKVVDKLDLGRDSEFNGGAGGFSIGGLIGTVRSLVSGQGGPSGQNRTEALAVENLARSLDIERGGKTFVISVSARTRDPEKSALVANTLVDTYVDAAGDIQSGTAGRAETEISSRLSELRKGVQKAEKAVEDYKATHDLVDAQGRLISDDQIVKINDQLSIARARTSELQARARSARAIDAGTATATTLPEDLNSAVLSELRSQYARLAQQAAALSVRLGPRHPERQAVDAQLQGLRGQIAAELRRIVSSLQVDLKRAVEQEQTLAARLAQAKARQADISDRLVDLRELEREAAAQRAVYENYLLRARDAAEQKGLNTANISVISTATPPLLASGPSRAMIALLLTGLGFVAGIGLAALRGALASLRGHPLETDLPEAPLPGGDDEPVNPGPGPGLRRPAPVYRPLERPGRYAGEGGLARAEASAVRRPEPARNDTPAAPLPQPGHAVPTATAPWPAPQGQPYPFPPAIAMPWNAVQPGWSMVPMGPAPVYPGHFWHGSPWPGSAPSAPMPPDHPARQPEDERLEQDIGQLRSALRDLRRRVDTASAGRRHRRAS